MLSLLPADVRGSPSVGKVPIAGRPEVKFQKVLFFWFSSRMADDTSI